MRVLSLEAIVLVLIDLLPFISMAVTVFTSSVLGRGASSANKEACAVKRIVAAKIISFILRIVVLYRNCITKSNKNYSIWAIFSNRVYSFIKASFIDPTGPFLCLAIITSAMPWFSEVGA